MEVDKKPNGYSLPVFLTKNADLTTPQGKVYDKLIKEAKSKNDVQGALYVAAITVPLDVANGNGIMVRSQDLLPEFMDSLKNHMIPIIYNHAFENDGAGWNFPADNQAPKVLGRVYSADVMPITKGDRNFKAIATGQIVTDPETIDRVMNMRDFNQSVTWVAPDKLCSICGEHPTSCDHQPGKIYNVKEGDAENSPTVAKRALEYHKPNRAYELSFVLMPAYHDCSVEMFTRNSISNGRLVLPRSYYQYAPKVQVNGIGPDQLRQNAITNAQVVTQQNKPSVTIANSQKEDSLMDPKEIKAKLDSLEGVIANATKLVENFIASHNAQTAAPSAPAAPAVPAPTANGGAPAAPTQNDVPAVIPGAPGVAGMPGQTGGLMGALGNPGAGTGASDDKADALIMETMMKIATGMDALIQSQRTMYDTFHKQLDNVLHALGQLTVTNAASTADTTASQAQPAAGATPAPATAAEGAAPTANTATPAAGDQAAPAADASAPTAQPQGETGEPTSSSLKHEDVLAGMFRK